MILTEGEPMSVSKAAKVREIELVVKQVYVQHALYPAFMETLVVDYSTYIEAIILKMRRMMAALEGAEISHPETWWDGLKQSLGQWVWRRFHRTVPWSWNVKTYKAIEYLPNVPLPANLRGGRMYIWEPQYKEGA